MIKECINCKNLINGNTEERRLYKFFKQDKTFRKETIVPSLCVHCYRNMSTDEVIESMSKLIDFYKNEDSPLHKVPYRCDKCRYMRDTRNLDKCSLCANGKSGFKKSNEVVIDEIFGAITGCLFRDNIDWIYKYILTWENIEKKTLLRYNILKYWSCRPIE